MPVSGINQVKTSVTPKGQRKAGVYLWGDTEATWGDTLATWGNFAIAPTNQTKPTLDTIFLVTDEIDFLVTDEGDFLVTSLGGGGGGVNQSKS